MFRDYAAFRAYVSRAEFIAVGTLTQWDGTSGAVEVKTVLRGKAPDETVRVLPTGGRVLSAPGQQVLFLLSRRDGKLKLHSFCDAPGLYAYSESLASLIKDALAAVPTLAVAESNVKQPDGELIQYGRPFPVVMIPQGASVELERLAKEIAKTIGAASVGRAEQNPVCCVWLEINHWTPNSGSPGFIIVNQPGGTLIQASNH